MRSRLLKEKGSTVDRNQADQKHRLKLVYNAFRPKIRELAGAPGDEEAAQSKVNWGKKFFHDFYIYGNWRGKVAAGIRGGGRCWKTSVSQGSSLCSPKSSDE